MAEAEKAQRRVIKRSRCAIYTRKSTEEGLEQGFNSLDAQREACVAFVQSQKHEGWSDLPTQYDDGGYSGGTMERPALQRLLADIEANRIDVVVVYKVDRLTRALSDFAKLTAAAFVSNGPAIDPEWGICPSEIGVQYQPDGRLSTFPKNTATFTGKLLIVYT
jgi:hypothetical protein